MNMETNITHKIKQINLTSVIYDSLPAVCMDSNENIQQTKIRMHRMKYLKETLTERCIVILTLG